MRLIFCFTWINHKHLFFKLLLKTRYFASALVFEHRKEWQWSRCSVSLDLGIVTPRTECHINRPWNARSTGSSRFTRLSKEWPSLCQFSQNVKLTRQPCLKNFFTYYREYPTNSYPVVLGHEQLKRPAGVVSTYGGPFFLSFFFLRKERLIMESWWREWHRSQLCFADQRTSCGRLQSHLAACLGYPTNRTCV